MRTMVKSGKQFKEISLCLYIDTISMIGDRVRSVSAGVKIPHSLQNELQNHARIMPSDRYSDVGGKVGGLVQFNPLGYT